MRKLQVTAIAAFGVAALASGAAHACGDVTITDFDWQSAQVNSAIAKFILTNGYGCNVTAVPSTTNTALVSLAENGQPDVLTEVWENANAAMLDMQAAGKVAFLSEVLSDGGQQGWWVPKYLVDEHPEMATLAGILASPAMTGGKFYSCPDGWTCNFTNANMAKAAGLADKGIEVFVPGSGETLATSLASAYADKQPWFGYYWAPSSLLGQNPMVKVDVGPYDQAAFDCNATADCATPAMSDYPRDKVWTVVTTDFQSREPEAASMLAKMAFSNQQLGEVMAWQDANKASPDEAAAYFLSTYKETWGGWLDDGAREKLGALLQ
ncbi:MAG: glycine betaine ABC transporter substrate-binding protein [Paracoccaceae bacterium]|nr:glycine betaine ABC transporter substrate-binding protein [Paracoccaceae bacterium]